jgi:hypothetical protein
MQSTTNQPRLSNAHNLPSSAIPTESIANRRHLRLETASNSQKTQAGDEF